MVPALADVVCEAVLQDETARTGEVPDERPAQRPVQPVGCLEVVEGAQGGVLTQLPHLTPGFEVTAEAAGAVGRLHEQRDEGRLDRP
ncbi:hypothetical protein [Streptomyces sp. NPDC054958]